MRARGSVFRMLPFIILFSPFLACKAVGKREQGASLKAAAYDAPFYHVLHDGIHFDALAMTQTSSETAIKFVATWPNDDFSAGGPTLYHINGRKHFLHEGFLKAEIDPYKDMPGPTIQGLLGYGADEPVPQILAGGIYRFRDIPEDLRQYSNGFDDIIVIQTRFSLKQAPTAALIAMKMAINDSFANDWMPPERIFLSAGWDSPPDSFPADVQQAVNISPFTNFMQLLTGKTAGQARVYTQASSWGRLRPISSAEVERGEYEWDEILFINDDQRLPVDIGPVAGVVTSPLVQTDLSHMILRTAGLKVPNAYVIAGRVEILGLNKPENAGKWFRFDASVDQYQNQNVSLVAAKPEDQAAIEAYNASRLPPRQEVPSNIENDKVLAWHQETMTGGTQSWQSTALGITYGAKGKNFAILDEHLRANGYAAERAFYGNSLLVPLAYYAQHVSQIVDEGACSEKYCKDFPGACATVHNMCLQHASGRPLSAVLGSFTDGIRAAKAQGMTDFYSFKNAAITYMQALIEEASFSNEHEVVLYPKLDRLVQGLPADAFVTDLLADIETLSDHPSWAHRIRFRSSTNAEDLAHLNGAGLYSSYSTCLMDDVVYKGMNPRTGLKDPSFLGSSEAALAKSRWLSAVKGLVTDVFAGRNPDAPTIGLDNDCDGSALQGWLDRIKEPSYCQTKREIVRSTLLGCHLQKKGDSGYAEYPKDIGKNRSMKQTMKKAFASVWNLTAFNDREFNNISHGDVYMGLLVHPSFRNEKANGVLVVSQDGDGYSVYMSGQIEDVSITNPIFASFLPERARVKVGLGGQASETTILAAAKINGEAVPVMTEAQRKSLAEQAVLVHRHFYDGTDWKSSDVEWVIAEDGKVLIKQARPMPVHPEG